MAITISGVNNNDRIVAQDGVIDTISGFNIAGILTATTFSVTDNSSIGGNQTVTGKVTAGHLDIGSNIQLGNAGVATATTFVGNLTGNVNATSNLLLQIGGSEKFRVGSSGQLGIGGANYGSSGQVLSSGGSGSAATWQTIDLSNLNASSLTSGTIPNARFPATLPALDGSNLTGIVGGKFNGPAAGIVTTSSVGIQTANVTSANLVGAASSLVGLYIGDGSLFFSNNLSRSGGYYITTGVNALNAGPVTLNSALTLDGTWVIV